MKYFGYTLITIGVLIILGVLSWACWHIHPIVTLAVFAGVCILVGLFICNEL